MDIALVILIYVGSFSVFTLTILAGNYLIAKRDHLDAQAQAIREDLRFRRGVDQ